MKKVLSAFFAVFLSMTGGYCENTSYVDTNLSSNDSMNSVISIRAIFEGLNSYECAYIQSDVKDEIARLIGDIISQGKNITLNSFLSICIGVNSKEDISEHVEKCVVCTKIIAEGHNQLIREHEEKQINNIDVFTSEEEYNKALKVKGVCTSRNSRWKPELNNLVHTKRGCEKTCKDYAIANACVLDGIGSEGKCECTQDMLRYTMSAGSYDEYYYQRSLYFTPYYVRPTWEDYKKLYNIK